MGDAETKDPTRILVAEDDMRIRMVLERLLAASGYDVVARVNGREALESLEQEGPFQVVITDINMPEMSGEELLREIKSRDARLPVIVLTARKDPGLITEVFRDGAYRFLSKPFTGDQLREVVSAALQEARSRTGDDLPVATIDEEGWVELTAPNRQEYLDRFQDFCDTLISSRLDERAKNELKIAVQELGQNAIEWGNAMSSDSRIRLSYRLLEDRILIRIADEGSGFDPGRCPTRRSTRFG